MPYADPERRREFERERSRRRTAERLARNLCPRCGKHQPEPGRAVCATCAETRREANRVRAAKRRAAGIGRVRGPGARKAEYRRARERADERVARGLCGKCGRHPHEPDRRLCADCGERQRRRDRERYARARDAGKLYGGRPVESRRLQARRRTRQRQGGRRAAGLCIRCGRGRPVDGGSSCRPCLEERRRADRETYAARRAAGLCTRCATPAFEGAPVCGPCAVIEARYQPKKTEANRARYAERRARWICTHCGKNPSFGASRCDDCARRAYERSEHVRRLPVYPPSFTVIERATGTDHGCFDSWEDVAIALAFARLTLDDVDVLIDQSPMQTAYML